MLVSFITKESWARKGMRKLHDPFGGPTALSDVAKKDNRKRRTLPKSESGTQRTMEKEIPPLSREIYSRNISHLRDRGP